MSTQKPPKGGIDTLYGDTLRVVCGFLFVQTSILLTTVFAMYSGVLLLRRELLRNVIVYIAFTLLFGVVCVVCFLFSHEYNFYKEQ